MIHIQLYTYTCRNSQHNNDERTHFFRKIYLSHFVRNGCKRVMCERWVGDWTETATYWPPVPLSLAALLSRFTGLLNRGPWELVLTDSNCHNWLQTNWTSCHTGLYHCLTCTRFLWASRLHPIQPVHCQGYTLISSTECTCPLIDGWLGGQYVTMMLIFLKAMSEATTTSFKLRKIFDFNGHYRRNKWNIMNTISYKR